MQEHLENNDDAFSELFRAQQNDHKHFIYYWNLDNPNQIDAFEKQYNDSYQLVFQGILHALKNGNGN